MTIVELLEAARADYEAHGFATGQFDDGHGNRCALGSINHCTTGTSYLLGAGIAYDATLVLNETAIERYGVTDGNYMGIEAAYVNDELGRDAVLDLYDAAIKWAREDAS